MKNNLKIGITEYGDAGLDFRWEERMNSVDGLILITKNLNPVFQEKVLTYMKIKPIIVHCTCTGWGGTVVEPNVPNYHTQLLYLQQLINAGFPVERIVLRIDPIFPTENGLKRVLDILQYARDIKLPLEKIRFRMSIVDEYPHVRERYEKAGFNPIYNGDFYASPSQMELAAKTLASTPYRFATCAEDKLVKNYPTTFYTQGCISYEDLKIMNIPHNDNFLENPQKRSGCHCLSCKTELLNCPRKKCSHNCIYCFWKD